MIILEMLKIFVLIAGFIIGLGAVTVIDLHGFLACKSNYWTEATTRTHKITKPLIWIGMIMVFVGGLFLYGGNYLIVHVCLSAVLILNGLFLSFRVSPFLIDRERSGSSSEILPKSWQDKIFVSFIFSFIGWWAMVVLFVLSIFSVL